MYYRLQSAAITLGPLECKGRSSTDFGGGSCHSLKLQGRPSGYYLLDTNNGTLQPIETTKPILHISKCNMSLGVSDPNFQMDLGFLTLFSGKVHIVADITANHYVRSGSAIPFDKIVMDPTHSFTLANSTFVAPWKGRFTFTKHRFRCTSSDRDMYGYVTGSGSRSSNFEIRTSDTFQDLEKDDNVVITRKDSSITLGCTERDPCRVTIQGEE